jgi:hypothetical protein
VREGGLRTNINSATLQLLNYLGMAERAAGLPTAVRLKKIAGSVRAASRFLLA